MTFMGVCDTYGKLLDIYGSFVIFMGVMTFMGRTLITIVKDVLMDYKHLSKD